MIIRNEREQWLGCTICGEQVELRRRTIANPEKLLLLEEQLRREHGPCAEHAGYPDKAARARDFQRRVDRELEKLAKSERQYAVLA